MDRYARAAEAGDAKAQNNLALCYVYAALTRPRRARPWRDALPRGTYRWATGQCRAGGLRSGRYGHGVPQDMASAVKW